MIHGVLQNMRYPAEFPSGRPVFSSVLTAFRPWIIPHSARWTRRSWGSWGSLRRTFDVASFKVKIKCFQRSMGWIKGKSKAETIDFPMKIMILVSLKPINWKEMRFTTLQHVSHYEDLVVYHPVIFNSLRAGKCAIYGHKKFDDLR